MAGRSAWRQKARNSSNANALPNAFASGIGCHKSCKNFINMVEAIDQWHERFVQIDNAGGGIDVLDISLRRSLRDLAATEQDAYGSQQTCAPVNIRSPPLVLQTRSGRSRQRPG